jgi:hypothetical protein
MKDLELYDLVRVKNEDQRNLWRIIEIRFSHRLNYTIYTAEKRKSSLTEATQRIAGASHIFTRIKQE